MSAGRLLPAGGRTLSDLGGATPAAWLVPVPGASCGTPRGEPDGTTSLFVRGRKTCNPSAELCPCPLRARATCHPTEPEAGPGAAFPSADLIGGSDPAGVLELAADLCGAAAAPAGAAPASTAPASIAAASIPAAPAATSGRTTAAARAATRFPTRLSF